VSTGSELYAVLPATVDDPRVPSGGNVYDRRVCTGLAGLGWRVHEVLVGGDWPYPSPRCRTALAEALAAVPTGALVLADGLVVCGVPEVVLPEARRLRFVVLVHLPLADEVGGHELPLAELDAKERATLRAARAVVVTGLHTAARVVHRHGIADRLVHVVSPGTAPAPLATGTDGATRLLCVASVTPRKGHDVLVRALAELADEPWTLDCVGPVPSSEYVEQLRCDLDEYGLAGRVRLLGPRVGAPLATLYSLADLVVLPSREEPYGMVITEALARGVPVLATRVGGIPEALGRAEDGTRPGLLVPPDDPVALADALRDWFADPERRSVLRSAARERRGMLPSWEWTTRRMETVLHGLKRGR
jgi:glycosyltransferase involved in cell wall biosynthesis